MKKLAILGEFNPASETHAATNAAIEHSKKLLEIDLDVSSKLACSLKGREMKLDLTPNSAVASLYGKLQVKEKYYCNFSVNPEYLHSIQSGPINIEKNPHPLVTGFLQAIMKNKIGEQTSAGAAQS